MIANMVMNVLFVGVLFALWHRPEQLSGGWLTAIAQVPGLHMGLALASTLASYLNLVQLWRALQREGIFVRQPGWAAHLLRLAVASAALTLVLIVAVVYWPDWSAWSNLTRVMRLAAVIGVASAVYVAVLFATGFRMKDLRGI